MPTNAVSGERRFTTSAPPRTAAMSFAYVKRVGSLAFADEVFAPIDIQGLASISHLAVRACENFPRWQADAGQVKLFVARSSCDDEPTAEEECAALETRLKTCWSLERAGIVQGSFLLAQVLPPPPTQGRRQLPAPTFVNAPSLHIHLSFLVRSTAHPPVSLSPCACTFKSALCVGFVVVCAFFADSVSRWRERDCRPCRGALTEVCVCL